MDDSQWGTKILEVLCLGTFHMMNLYFNSILNGTSKTIVHAFQFWFLCISFFTRYFLISMILQYQKMICESTHENKNIPSEYF